ncbi:Oligopeptide ABC transporter, periplasmic oligopeptide-binding protein OppA (TC 3.A.1.5.1) [hydrothermal vent metagenome]|uniref:Oligopeptide ABC transporter, periplasmic oligopeptide-binding protein OppA (TC 3.A.1.5.1) n=1 Tax=hydrothermal vent metagenome TaxID=652676 RepID=A0A3B1D133_9ZZZZ
MAHRWPSIVALTIFLTITACSKPENPPRQTGPEPKAGSVSDEEQTASKPDDFGDVFIDGSIGDASNLIPYLSGDTSSSAVTSMVFAGLMKVDKDQSLIPDLAKSWDISEDQRTIKFHLRDDVKWHDGAPWTSGDLQFQYEMMIHPDVPSAYKETFLQIEKTETPDDFTFIVTFKEPFAPALARLSGMGGLPRHLLSKTKPVDLIKSPLARKPVGNGAWRFVKWQAQTKIVVESNPDHYDGRPMIRQAVTRIIPDTATQFLELKSGGIDMMALRPLQYLKQTDTKFFKDNYVKYKYLGNGYTYLGYNLKRPLFADKRVRQALTYAIDKNEVIEGVLLGLGQVATGPFKPGSWAYKNDVKKYEYSPQKAKALFAEAGWIDTDGDGTLDKDGKLFEFEIVTNQGNNLRSKTAEIIQQKLKKVGVKVNVRVIEWSSFINNFINKRDFDACILGWGLGLDPDQYSIWHSSKTGEHEFNFVSYSNSEADEILEKARRTFDQEERKKYYFRFQDILADEQPYTFLYVAEALPVVSKRIRGIVPGLSGISYNFDKWWVPKSEHKHIITK